MRRRHQSVRDTIARHRLTKLIQQANPNEVKRQRNEIHADGERRVGVVSENGEQNGLRKTIQTNAIRDRAQIAHTLVGQYAVYGYVDRVELL